MINANDNSRFMRRIQEFIGRLWGWPDQGKPSAKERGVRIAPELLARYEGYYEVRENFMVALAANHEGTGLETLVDGLPDVTYMALDSVHFQSSEEGMSLTFTRDSLDRSPVFAPEWAIGRTNFWRRGWRHSSALKCHWPILTRG